MESILPISDDSLTFTFVAVSPLNAQDAMMETLETLLLLARLINRQAEVFRGFGRRSP